MAVPPGVIDEIRDRSDLLQVIGDYVSLKKAGRNWVGLCPFHPDQKTPSFSVSPEKGMFYCFGCGAGGNIFTFLMRVENLTFMEAVERLAKRAGVEIPKRPLTPDEQTRKVDKERIAALMEEATVFYHRLLTKDSAGEEGREYLKKRAIDIELAREFRLGWAPREWDVLFNYLNSRGFSPKDLEKSGMAVERSSGGFYDRFRGRIMFPIMSVQNRVLGFGGRVVVNEDEPKYMNSPESPLYQKSRVLYGLNAAHKAIGNRDAAIIVEGYFDLLSLVKHGFENTVAPCGTALTVDQVAALKRYTKNLYPLFDPDEAGDKARMRALEVILKAGAYGKSAVLPKGLDPDEFVLKEGKEALEKVLEASKSLLDVAVEGILNENGTSVEGRRKSLTSIANLLAQMSDLQAREMYLQEYAPRLGGSIAGAEDLLRREVASISGSNAGAQQAAPLRGDASPVKARKDSPEYYLLALLLAHPELSRALEHEENVSGDIDDPELARLFKRILEEGVPEKPSQYLDSVEPGCAARLSRLVMEEPESDAAGNIDQIWKDTVLRVKLLKIRRLKEELQVKLSGAKPEDEETKKLLRQKNELMEREKRLKQAAS